MNQDNMETPLKILVTGAAGFIGFHLCQRLLHEGHEVVGVDSLNNYYSVQLKKARLHLLSHPRFSFYPLDLCDLPGLQSIFKTHQSTHVVNLAAQAGVRYSIENPRAYIDSNVVGYLNLLECCRHSSVQHFVFASSSSVYGLNTQMPFSVHHNVDHPISLYAATKKANELMAHTYSYLYNLPCTGLRFFTVYGPWGRPDMALFLFTEAILNGKPIKIFNKGIMQRDFTFIDDIIEGVLRVTLSPPKPNIAWDGAHPDPSSSPAPYRLYNIGNNNSVQLMRFIEVLEDTLGQKAIKEYLPMQPGDVSATYADIDDLAKDVHFKPQTTIETGIPLFVNWYQANRHLF